MGRPTMAYPFCTRTSPPLPLFFPSGVYNADFIAANQEERADNLIKGSKAQQVGVNKCGEGRGVGPSQPPGGAHRSRQVGVNKCGEVWGMRPRSFPLPPPCACRPTLPDFSAEYSSVWNTLFIPPTP